MAPAYPSAFVLAFDLGESALTLDARAAVAQAVTMDRLRLAEDTMHADHLGLVLRCRQAASAALVAQRTAALVSALSEAGLRPGSLHVPVADGRDIHQFVDGMCLIQALVEVAPP